MSEIPLVFSLTAGYKAFAILAGCFLAWLGFELFRKGVSGKTGTVETKAGQQQLSFRNAAPGAFFILMGGLVVLLVVAQGIDFEQDKLVPHTPSTAASPRSRPAATSRVRTREKSTPHIELISSGSAVRGDRKKSAIAPRTGLRETDAAPKASVDTVKTRIHGLQVCPMFEQRCQPDIRSRMM